jgi:hypothetical protein
MRQIKFNAILKLPEGAKIYIRTSSSYVEITKEELINNFYDKNGRYYTEGK